MTTLDMDLEQLIYRSELSPTFRRGLNGDLPDLLEQARRLNAARRITGLLLVYQGCFIQLIEGRPDQLDVLISALERDPRHRNMNAIGRRKIKQRAFPDWTMSARDLSADDERIHKRLDEAGAALPPTMSYSGVLRFLKRIWAIRFDECQFVYV